MVSDRIKAEYKLNEVESLRRAVLVIGMGKGLGKFEYPPPKKRQVAAKSKLWTNKSSIAFEYCGSDPASAIDALFAEGATIDCERSVLALEYLAERLSLGGIGFNKKYGNRRIAMTVHGGFQAEKARDNYVTKSFKSLDELVPGDWVYFKNKDDYLKHNPGGLWSGEHAIYMGKESEQHMFKGFGTRVQSYEQMVDELADAYVSGMAESKEEKAKIAEAAKKDIGLVKLRRVPL